MQWSEPRLTGVPRTKRYKNIHHLRLPVTSVQPVVASTLSTDPLQRQSFPELSAAPNSLSTASEPPSAQSLSTDPLHQASDYGCSRPESNLADSTQSTSIIFSMTSLSSYRPTQYRPEDAIHSTDITSRVSTPIRTPTAPVRVQNTDPASCEIAHILRLSEVQKHQVGPKTCRCRFCNALYWPDERVNPSAKIPNSYVFNSCCKAGSGCLSDLDQPPDLLQTLFTDDTDNARHFRRNIISYNNALTFTSCCYTPDERLRGIGGIHPFQIRGELFHLQGPLRHAQGQLPSFAQLYFYDPLYASGSRFAQHPELRETLLRALFEIIQTCGNPFIQFYKTAQETLEQHEQEQGRIRVLLNPQMRLVLEQGADQRRSNLPTSTEVSVFIPDEASAPGTRDIVLAQRYTDPEQSRFVKINRSHAAYMPLHYVLLFPTGKPGWNWTLRLLNEAGQRQRVRISQRMYFRYHLYSRTNVFSPILNAARLFQQYVVDCYAVLDQQILDYLRFHQNKLRADVYSGVQDAIISDDVNAAQLGRRIILPSSFSGSDRHMQQLFQNSMAIVRYFGKPTLFITFTANPQWPEVLDDLEGQSLENRPDVMARIFNIKRKALLKDIQSVFGQCLGFVWTLEFQKRGLPHIHILLFLHRDSDFLDCERIDNFICAELPSPEWDPDNILTKIVQHQLTHGPCGEANLNAPCMIPNPSGSGQICSKKFPKAFNAETVVNEDGYPVYRRRQDGRTWIKKVRGREVPMDNRYVVPYSPFLALKYNAHINVEVCASVQAIKYIHKYIYKGGDRVTVQLQNENDEIARYLNGRYIGPQQAVWNILEFDTHAENPPVQALAIHLPGKQPLYFAEDATSEQVQAKLDRSASTLTGFFQYNTDHETARQYLYQEFPGFFVWKQAQTGSYWKPRERGFSIGRMYHCSPVAGERFYLRLLLTVVRGPTSFEHLRTVNDILYPTFKQACIALQLLNDDNEWIACFTEAVRFSSGFTLRILFITALAHGDVTDPNSLWLRFGKDICDDLPRLMANFSDIPSDLESPHIDYGLFLIQRGLADLNHTLTTFGMPLPQLNWDANRGNTLIAAEQGYDLQIEEQEKDRYMSALNPDQTRAFQTIVTAIDEDPDHAHFFLQGPAGTGKTFLYSALCHYYRAQGCIVLCVASSGIAALLLPGGQTSHSRFKIPLTCTEASTCDITQTSQLADLIRATRLIIWDEVPMQHKHNISAVHHTLCDIRRSENALFGAIPMVFGGDFAQTLPIVRRGNRAQQVDASLRNSFLWNGLQILRLQKNMRIISGPENARFAAWINAMSYEPRLYGTINLPVQIRNRFFDLEQFCSHVYPPTEVVRAHTTPDFFRQRAILTLRNDTAAEFNLDILNRMPGAIQTICSVDSADVNADNDYHLPVEFLQSLAPAGLPPSILQLKKGAPIILLRNLLPKQGLCNGTRMVITHLNPSCIEAAIIGGSFNGQKRCLFRTKLTTKEGDYPFLLTRTQFPIRLCFAMTINKAQGQSFEKVGIDLRSPCFSHGQLYVALSRVTNVSHLSILFKNPESEQTSNIVYPEILLLKN